MTGHSSRSTLVMVVDADAQRRARIVAALAPATVIEAVSLHDAFSLVEELRPAAVGLSDLAAAEPGLEMFAQLLRLVGSRWAVYGRIPPSNLPARASWLPLLPGDEPDAIVDVLLGRGVACAASAAPDCGPGIIVIGASTGGIVAIKTVLAGFPANCPPTLIVQHIRPGFIDGMIRRLAECCAPRVIRAVDGAPLARGTVHVAADDGCHLTIRNGPVPVCRVRPSPAEDTFRPSVDALFGSAAAFGPRVAAAILTGMGNDGTRGMGAIRAAGGFTIAQDEASSTVYGMPRAATQAGAAMKVLPLDRIAATLLAGRPGAKRHTRRPA